MDGGWHSRVSEIWASAGTMADIDVVAAIDALVAERAADDASAVFEAASVRDYAGLESEAEPLHRRAIELGLDDATLPQAIIQLASTLRNIGKIEESVGMLQRHLQQHPDDKWTGPTSAFLALALISRGNERDGASVALTALAEYLPVYSGTVRNYARQLRN